MKFNRNSEFYRILINTIKGVCSGSAMAFLGYLAQKLRSITDDGQDNQY